MSVEAIFVALFGWLATVGGAYVGLLVSTARVKNALEVRIVRIETFLFTVMGQKAASILHSPHTPELDRLLETYIGRHHEMDREDWQRLKQAVDAMLKEGVIDKEKRFCAAFLSALCDHKLSLPKYA